MADRLTWKREPREKGLASACQGERGFRLRLNRNEVAWVSPLYKGFGCERDGYFWHASIGKECRNNPAPTVEDAKAQCLAWVKYQLKKEAEAHD